MKPSRLVAIKTDTVMLDDSVLGPRSARADVAKTRQRIRGVSWPLFDFREVEREHVDVGARATVPLDQREAFAAAGGEDQPGPGTVEGQGHGSSNARGGPRDPDDLAAKRIARHVVSGRGPFCYRERDHAERVYSHRLEDETGDPNWRAAPAGRGGGFKVRERAGTREDPKPCLPSTFEHAARSLLSNGVAQPAWGTFGDSHLHCRCIRRRDLRPL